MGREKFALLPLPLPLETDGKAGPVDIRTGKLFLTLSISHIQESRPWDNTNRVSLLGKVWVRRATSTIRPSGSSVSRG